MNTCRCLPFNEPLLSNNCIHLPMKRLVSVITVISVLGDHERNFIKLLTCSDRNMLKAIASFVSDCDIT